MTQKLTQETDTVKCGPCCDHPTTWFLRLWSWFEECGRAWNFGLGKPLNTGNRTDWIMLVGAWSSRMLREMGTMEAWIMRFQRQTRTPSTAKLGTIIVTFQQRTWMHSACVLRTRVGLNLKVMD